MALDSWQFLKTAEAGLAAQEAELAGKRTRQTLTVVSKTATGSGDMDETFSLDRSFRLVFIRCHFAGTSGTAPLIISIDSASGSAYDVRLFTITKAGTARDVNFRVTAEESREPSPWTFHTGDGVRMEWTNPDVGNITWGIEVGLAVAS